MLDGNRRGGPAAPAAERRARLTSQLRSHVITWNKSMKKHCHHYCDGGEGGGGDTFLTCPTHLAHTVISAFPVHTHTSLMALCGLSQNHPQWCAASLRGSPGDCQQRPAGPSPGQVRCDIRRQAWGAWLDIEVQLKHLMWRRCSRKHKLSNLTVPDSANDCRNPLKK